MVAFLVPPPVHSKRSTGSDDISSEFLDNASSYKLSNQETGGLGQRVLHAKGGMGPGHETVYFLL